MTRRWAIEFWPSPLLPGVVKYRHAHQRTDPARSITAAHFPRLRAWWEAEYGAPTVAVTAAGRTTLTFTPQPGRAFRLSPPHDWGRYVYREELGMFRECDG